MYDEKRESEEFLKKVEPFVLQLRHLAFCFDKFLVGHETSKEYLKSVNELSAMAKSAFTKAILVDYSAVFMKNKFGTGHSITVSTEYLTKSPLFSKDIHAALIELRHQLVAHSDYKHPGISATVAEFINNQSDPNTHKSVFVPTQFFLQNISMLFIDSVEIIEQIVNHLNVCKNLTFDKARTLVEVLRNKMINYAPVLNSADFVDVLTITSRSEARAKNTTDPLNIEPKEVELKIGRTNVQFVVTRVRMDRPFQGEFEGNGFRIVSKFNETDSSKVNINVTFIPIKQTGDSGSLET